MPNHSKDIVPPAELLSNLDSGHLLDHLEAQLQATNSLQSGNPGGLIESLNNRRTGIRDDGVGPLNVGADGVRSMNYPATIASSMPKANKKRELDSPRKLHVLADWGYRYYGDAGAASLLTLARMSVAMACLSAEHAPSTMMLVVTGKSVEPKVFDDFDKPFEATEALKAYDRFIAKPGDLNFKKNQGPSSLINGLQAIEGEEISEENDACLVVSDFLSGPIEDDKGQLAAFEWETALRSIHSRISDRLFVIRLTSPSHVFLPPDMELTDGQRTYSMDLSSYLSSAQKYYQQGSMKAEKVAHILQTFRHIDLSSTDKAPFIAVADFMFGVPV